MSANGWSRGEIIALLSLLVGMVACVVALIIPETRHLLGLDSTKDSKEKQTVEKPIAQPDPSTPSNFESKNKLSEPSGTTPKNKENDLRYSPQQEVGTYRAYSNVAIIDFVITFENGKLILTVVGQGTALLENIGGRRYKPVGPGHEGAFLTFRPVNGDESKTEIFLEQPPPKSDFVLTKIQ